MKRLLLIVSFLVVMGGLVAWIFLRRASESTEQTAPALPAVVKQDLDIPTLKTKAEGGDSHAQTELGKAFATGQGVPIDYKQAAHWFGLAATNGSFEAQAALGELYQAGQGVKTDLAMAAQWFTKAAEGGNVTGQFDLAYLYDTGSGVPKNPQLASKWYGLAAEGGDSMSQYLYGQRRFEGLGVDKDPVEGLKWMRLAAAQGQTDAATSLKAAEKEMTSLQITEAKQRAEAFAPRVSAK